MRFVSHWPLGVPLLFLAYLPGGTRRERGWLKQCAYTATRLSTGTRNATETFEGGCSLHGLLGARMVGGVIRPTRASRSSFTGRGFSTGRLGAGVRRLAGRDRRSHAAFVERVRFYCDGVR